jgi:hypothetical protein
MSDELVLAKPVLEMLEVKWRLNPVELCEPIIREMFAVSVPDKPGPQPCRVVDVKLDLDKFAKVVNQAVIAPLTTQTQTAFDIGVTVGKANLKSSQLTQIK